MNIFGFSIFSRSEWSSANNVMCTIIICITSKIFTNWVKVDNVIINYHYTSNSMLLNFHHFQKCQSDTYFFTFLRFLFTCCLKGYVRRARQCTCIPDIRTVGDTHTWHCPHSFIYLIRVCCDVVHNNVTFHKVFIQLVLVVKLEPNKNALLRLHKVKMIFIFRQARYGKCKMLALYKLHKNP